MRGREIALARPARRERTRGDLAGPRRDGARSAARATARARSTPRHRRARTACAGGRRGGPGRSARGRRAAPTACGVGARMRLGEATELVGEIADDAAAERKGQGGEPALARTKALDRARAARAGAAGVVRRDRSVGGARRASRAARSRRASSGATDRGRRGGRLRARPRSSRARPPDRGGARAARRASARIVGSGSGCVKRAAAPASRFRRRRLRPAGRASSVGLVNAAAGLVERVLPSVGARARADPRAASVGAHPRHRAHGLRRRRRRATASSSRSTTSCSAPSR